MKVEKDSIRLFAVSCAIMIAMIAPSSNSQTQSDVGRYPLITQKAKFTAARTLEVEPIPIELLTLPQSVVQGDVHRAQESDFATANTFTVTSTLNSGVGSLRQAMLDANSNPGPDIIAFSIGGGGVRTITPSSALPQITSPVLIDGTTQPGFSGIPLIEINGSAAGAGVNGLYITAGNSIVKGLIINRFVASGIFNGHGIVLDAGSGNTIQGNYIGTNAAGTASLQNGGSAILIAGNSIRNLIGGLLPSHRNLLSGNYGDGLQITPGNAGRNLVQGNYIGVDNSGANALPNGGNGVYVYANLDTIGGAVPGAGNVISGNLSPGLVLGSPSNFVWGSNLVQGNYIGPDAAGTSFVSNNQIGIYISNSPNNIIGGTSLSARNVISGNYNPGIVIIYSGATGNKIIGNYIGTDVTGMFALPNVEGVYINGAPNNIIGGSVFDERNVISGNAFYGVDIRAGSTGTRVRGNYIGTNHIGTGNLGNGADGVYVLSSRDTIGGVMPLDGNLIAFNGGAGVYVSSGTGNVVRKNSIFSHVNGLGIDLAPFGITVNDSLDGDTGANDLQNFPLLDSAKVESGSTFVHGRLNSRPNNFFTLDFYTNDSAHASTFGEGKTFIGSINVTTDNAGNSTFSATLTAVQAGNVITATATDTAGNTSEFSQALTPGFLSVLRPLLGETVVNDQLYDIQWRADNIDSLKIEFSTDNGQSYHLVVRSVGARANQFTWVAPESVSTKCFIRISDVGNPSTNAKSPRFKMKGYQLTRFKQNGDYERFLPWEDGWQWGNRRMYMWPQSWWSQFNYFSGIDPYTSQPYGPTFAPIPHPFPPDSTFPDWPLFVKVFGQGECYYTDVESSEMTYSSYALTFWRRNSNRTWKGACSGFSISSLLAFDDPGLFQSVFPEVGSFTNLYDLPLDNNRRRVINQFQLYFSGSEHRDYARWQSVKTVRQTLQDLKTMFLSETRDDKYLFIRSNNRSRAHAVVPVYLQRTGAPGQYRLLLYDNNCPGGICNDNGEPWMDLDSAANTWSYAQLRWSGTKGFFLMDPVSTYYTPPGMYRPTGSQNDYPVSVNTILFLNTQEASIVITDSLGRTIGFGDSTVQNTLTDANPIIPPTSEYEPPIGYDLPNGPYSVRMSSFTDSVAAFTAITNSRSFTYWRNAALSDQTDLLSFRNGLDAGNHDGMTKTIHMEGIARLDSSEHAFQILNCALGSSDSMRVFLPDTNQLKFVNLGPQKNYDLRVQLAGVHGHAIFEHPNISIPANSSHTVTPNWQNLNQPVKIYIDLGNNGTIDDSLSVANQPLPVQLASFTASLDSLHRVALNWMTISETNNYGFFVQKKRHSETAWTEIPNSFIPGHGTTIEPHRYTFTDANTLAGHWHYRLKQVDLDGTINFSEPVSVSTLTSVADNSVPEKFELRQNYPNPFNPSTTIKFSIAQAGSTSLRVFNILGQEVATLVNEELKAGYFEVKFNAANFASGVYLYKLTAGNFSSTRKMLLTR